MYNVGNPYNLSSIDKNVSNTFLPATQQTWKFLRCFTNISVSGFVFLKEIGEACSSLCFALRLNTQRYLSQSKTKRIFFRQTKPLTLRNEIQGWRFFNRTQVYKH
jgi:hypothetical protein